MRKNYTKCNHAKKFPKLVKIAVFQTPLLVVSKIAKITIFVNFLNIFCFSPRGNKKGRLFMPSFLEGYRFALAGEKQGLVATLDPLAGVLGIIVHQNPILADEVNLAARAHNADEPLGGHFGDVLGEPVQLALPGVLVGGLGEDVHQRAGGDEVPHSLDILNERGEVREVVTAEGLRPLGVGGMEISQNAVHVEVVSH